MDCLFCKIAVGEILAKKVWEDENVFAFLDINPSSPGHTVVIPKKHASTMFEFSREELGVFFDGVKKVMQKIKDSKLAPQGFNVGINHNGVAGQEIMHLHVHIIPRWKNDGGESIQSIIKKHSQGESLESVLAKII